MYPGSWVKPARLVQLVPRICGITQPSMVKIARLHNCMVNFQLCFACEQCSSRSFIVFSFSGDLAVA